MKEYIQDGKFWFAEGTLPEIRDIINKHYSGVCKETRLNFVLGDKETGKVWGDVETGYIGRSTGTQKIPLVVHNKRSFGGGALLSDCVVLVKFTGKNGRVLYKHPNFHVTENTDFHNLKREYVPI